MKSAILAVVAFLALASAASAAPFLMYDQYGNLISGYQGPYGGNAFGNYGQSYFWSGQFTPSFQVPVYQPYPQYWGWQQQQYRYWYWRY